MSPFVALVIGVFIGAVIGGVLIAMLVQADEGNPDTGRMNAIVLFGWHVSNNGGRWGILVPVNGVLTMLGESHSSLRGAVDAALEKPRG